MKKAIASMTVLSFLFSLVLAGRAETRFEARLTAPASAGDVSGKVQYRDRGRRQFSVEVEGLQPGDRYDVMISSAVVGTITIDAFGIGNLDYDSNFEPGFDDPATQFPPNFPALDGGEMVVVGSLSGTIQQK